MKQYQATIRAATIVGTYAATMKALSKIKADTEDNELIELLDAAIAHLQDRDSYHGRSVVPSSLEQHTDQRAKKLISYCRKRVQTAIPEWQVLALRHGWKPTPR